jgi:thioesterase domain-containing protein
VSAVGPLETFLSSHFQADEIVLERLEAAGRRVVTADVSGRHFSLYGEPQVAEVALQLCALAAQL